MKKDKVKDFKFSRNSNKSYPDETDMIKDKGRVLNSEETQINPNLTKQL